MFLTGKRLPPTSAVWRTGAYYTNRKISPSSTYLAFTCRKSTSEYQRKPLNPKQEQNSSGAWLCDRVGLSFPKTLPALGRWSAAGAGDRRGGASWRGSALPRACSTASPGNTCSGGCDVMTSLNSLAKLPVRPTGTRFFPSFYYFNIWYKPDTRSTHSSLKKDLFSFSPDLGNKAIANVPDLNRGNKFFFKGEYIFI